MKDKIIKILNDKMYAYDAVHEWNQPVIMGYDSAAEAISKLIPRWIPVSEKLPEDGEIVLTNTKAFGLSINTYRARDKERYMLYVLGWIPGSDLLKLPKEAK